MKKFGILFMIMLILLLLVACASPDREPVLDGFNYVFNDDGEYIWLGMTRQEAEHVVSLSSVDNRTGDLLGDGILVHFDEYDLASIILLSSPSTLWSSPSSWSIRGDLAPGSYIGEIEDLFDMNYVHFSSLIPGTLIFSFSFAHTPIKRPSGEIFYDVTFRQGLTAGWEERISSIIISGR